MLVNELGAPDERGAVQDRTIKARSAWEPTLSCHSSLECVIFAADEVSLREVIDAISRERRPETQDLLNRKGGLLLSGIPKSDSRLSGGKVQS